MVVIAGPLTSKVAQVDRVLRLTFPAIDHLVTSYIGKHTVYKDSAVGAMDFPEDKPRRFRAGKREFSPCGTAVDVEKQPNNAAGGGGSLRTSEVHIPRCGPPCRSQRIYVRIKNLDGITYSSVQKILKLSCLDSVLHIGTI